MECKESSFLSIKTCLAIGIYPEWNVKGKRGQYTQEFNPLEYIQNGM